MTNSININLPKLTPVGTGNTAGSSPVAKSTAQETSNFHHQNADTDGGPNAKHHTLGYGPGQAASGSELALFRQGIGLDLFGSMVWWIVAPAQMDLNDYATYAKWQYLGSEVHFGHTWYCYVRVG